MKAQRWVSRLARMDGRELLFRTRAAARSGAGRLAASWRPPSWRREGFHHRLRPVSPAVQAAAQHLAGGHWRAAHDALVDHFVARPARYPVAPGGFARIAEAVRRDFPASVADADARGRSLLDGRHDLLGYHGLVFRESSGARVPIDWHLDPVHGRRAPSTWWARVPFLDPACGDHKIIWELNRHQHWLALARAAWLTGDGRYRDEVVRQLAGWLSQNPPLTGINWASMLELSLRSLSWTWTLHALVGMEGEHSPDVAGVPWLVDLLCGLDEQLRHVEHNLSFYFSPNTHLTGEALGLYVCGRALPELGAAARWASTGRSVLLAEIARQIAPDGGHCERSAHYHRYTLDFYVLALAVARATGDPCEAVFATALSRLADAAALLADDGGRLPMIGDDDGGTLFPICRRHPADIRDSLAAASILLERPDLAMGAAPEEPMWLIGRTSGAPADEGPTNRRRSGALRDTGFYVSRPRSGDHVVIDGGPHGFLNGGHAHADALSLVVTRRRSPLFIDPGTGAYTASAEWRERFRSSQWHNTLTLDGRSQSITAGPFHWKTSASARVDRWHAGQGFDYFEGVEDGYAPIVHRRRVLSLADGLLVVVDSVRGGGTHTADVHWHVGPEWSVVPRDGQGLFLVHEDGARQWMLTPGIVPELLRADEKTGLGWHSPAYGSIRPCTTIRLRRRASTPAILITVVGAGCAGPPTAADCDAESVGGSGIEQDPVGVPLHLPWGSLLFVFASWDPGSAATATRVRTGGERIETDGRIALLRRGLSGEPIEASVLDGSYLRTSERVEPLLAAPRRVEGVQARVFGREAGTGQALAASQH